MLEAQVEVYEGTKRADRVPREQRDRDSEIEAGRLSRKEAVIVTEADKALAILHEEGTAVAFPEAVTDMRDDMEQVVVRLAQAKVGEITQGVEEDIIVALEELIAALQKAQKDMQNKAKPMPGQGGQPSEPPLVDPIAEIKMIRSMQMWVNKRTKRYAELTKTEQAEQPELLSALKRLGEREQRIHRITRDIVVGRNQ
jgi:ClpP class serine protease